MNVQTLQLRTQQGTLVGQIQDLTTTLAARTQEAQHLQDRLADLRNRENEVLTTLATLQQEAQQTSAQIGAGERRLAEIQDVARGASENVARLAGENTEQTNHLAGLRQLAAATAGDLQQTVQRRDELQQQIAQLEQHAAELQQEAANRQAAIIEAERDLQALRALAVTARGERDQARQAMMAAQETTSQTRSQAQQIAQQIAQTTQRLSDRNAELAALNQQAQQVADQLAASQQRLAQLNEQVAARTQEIQQAESRLAALQSSLHQAEESQEVGRLDGVRQDLAPDDRQPSRAEAAPTPPPPVPPSVPTEPAPAQ
jgi:chromosome segregation ATPase